jgi:photosystem II stability/assembly factor-like uncharacterized protein
MMEGEAMTATTSQAYVYVGLAGETVPGREVRSGLYRSRAAETPWELLTTGLPPDPQVRAIAVHPQQPNIVVIGTQHGVYRSEDHGDHWTRLDAPTPGLAVWSLLYHPHNPEVLFAGYEPYAIYRSEHGGTGWQRLPISATFPDVTMRPRELPKRIIGMAIDPTYPTDLYAAVEVGGALRSLDGGEHWEGISEGHYLNDDPVDFHGVAVSAAHPRTVYTIGRIGMSRSPDQGEHWQHVELEPLSPRGTYCRDIRVAPDDPNTLYVAAGAGFRSNEGALFRSRDGGHTWSRLDLGVKLQSTLFAIDIDARQPRHLYCATSDGEVLCSRDAGDTWRAHPLPPEAKQVYRLAVG